MKFLCVPCDKPMNLAEAAPPDRGSIALRYACDACGYEFAMLTNPFETQLVGSLGVKVGPEESAAAADGAAGGASAGGSKCPFSAMMQPGGALAGPEAQGSSADGAHAAPPSATPSSLAGLRWSPGAKARMETVPEFVRPMAVTGIEKFAQEKGYAEVDERVLSEARDFFGMTV